MAARSIPISASFTLLPVQSPEQTEVIHAKTRTATENREAVAILMGEAPN
jgi:hypothetical protein